MCHCKKTHHMFEMEVKMHSRLLHDKKNISNDIFIFEINTQFNKFKFLDCIDIQSHVC